MAKKGHRIQIKMKSTESAHIYFLSKNKNNTQAKLELSKFDPTPSVRKHVVYKESK